MYGRKILKPAFGKRIPLSDELIGSHWSAVIHSQDRDEAIRHWETAVSGQGDFLFEPRLAPSNGEVVWTRHNAALVTDHVPGSGYVHAIEDISIYKRHEKAQRVAEEKERAQVTLNSIK